MKVCTKCGEQKPLTEYFVKDNATGRLHAQCKLCYKAHRKNYYAAHYKKYGDKYRFRAKIRHHKIKQELHCKMLDFLIDKACEICGENDLRVLDFDHLEPNQKKFGIAQAMTYGMPWEKIETEIKKCRILCANCHRRHTAEQNGWYKFALIE
jgi:hypothetical protein